MEFICAADAFIKWASYVDKPFGCWIQPSNSTTGIHIKENKKITAYGSLAVCEKELNSILLRLKILMLWFPVVVYLWQ